MKKLLYGGCLLGLVILTACSSDEPVIRVNEHSSEGRASSSFKVPLNQALERADVAFQLLEGENGLTRGGRNIRIPSGVICLKSDNSFATRSGDEELPDTMIYIINYGENDGFAIMSADNRTRPLYAISDEGHFDLADTINNKGLSIFLAHMGMDYMNSVAGINILPKDSMKIDPNYPYISDDTGDKKIFVRGTRPILDYTVVTWGGNHPFNSYCPIVTDTIHHVTGRATAGCVAVAMAQMMSHFEHPDHYKSHTYDWNQMKSDVISDDIALLLADLGKPENLNTKYGINSSSAYIDSIKGTFIRFGYQVPVRWKSLSFKSMSPHLHTAKEPLLIFAGAKGYKDGHVWIIDGCMQYSSDEINWSEPLYHCVWGWQGSANGYYYFNDGEIDMNNPAYLEYPKPSWMNTCFIFYGVRFLSGLEINPNY